MCWYERYTTMRRRSLLIALVLGALLAPAASAAAAPFRATLKAPDHRPHADRDWWITVTAKSNSGRPLHATAVYQYLYQGQIVATRYPSPHLPDRHTPWPFFGRFSDPLLWPRRSIGIPLTFRVVVRVKGLGTVNLDWAVRVRR
jgi:hypothetical protein